MTTAPVTITTGVTVAPAVLCVCGDYHDPDYCCVCGHVGHNCSVDDTDPDAHPAAGQPCGNYQCCVD